MNVAVGVDIAESSTCQQVCEQQVHKLVPGFVVVVSVYDDLSPDMG